VNHTKIVTERIATDFKFTNHWFSFSHGKQIYRFFTPLEWTANLTFLETGVGAELGLAARELSKRLSVSDSNSLK